MDKEKLEKYSRTVFLILGTLLLAYLAFTRLLVIVIPFFLSWGVAFSVRPLAHKIAGRVKIPHKWISLLLTLLVIVGGLALLAGILIYAGREAWSFLSGLASDERIYKIIEKILNPLSGIFGESEGALEIEARIAEAIKGMLSSLLSGFVNVVTNIAGSIPGIFIFLLTTVISAVYFSMDLENINLKVRKALPEKIGNTLVSFKNKFLLMAFRYMRSYLFIMLIVFFILLTGFFIIGVRYALLLAVIFALLDMLPLVGIGTFMLPWGIFEIIFDNPGRGIGIIILFVVTEIIRNLIEPKILGKNLGIHPILTLVLLYASYSLFGIFGLLLIPLLTVILNIVIDKNNSSEVGKGSGGE